MTLTDDEEVREFLKSLAERVGAIQIAQQVTLRHLAQLSPELNASLAKTLTKIAESESVALNDGSRYYLETVVRHLVEDDDAPILGLKNFREQKGDGPDWLQDIIDGGKTT